MFYKFSNGTNLNTKISLSLHCSCTRYRSTCLYFSHNFNILSLFTLVLHCYHNLQRKEMFIMKANYHRINSIKLTWFVTCTRNRALTNTASAWPSLKYSLSVVLNFFEYFTNSFFLCSTACLPGIPGIKATTSFTASRSFLMALAISLQKIKRRVYVMRINHDDHQSSTHLIVSRNVLRSVISSGIRLKIRFKAADFLFSSWNASSLRLRRYSITVRWKGW